MGEIERSVANSDLSAIPYEAALSTGRHRRGTDTKLLLDLIHP
jgi:hypothetical protein